MIDFPKTDTLWNTKHKKPTVMKHLLTTLTLILLSLSTLMAQPSHHQTGDISIDAGLGFGTRASEYSLLIPPVNIDAEYTLLTFGAGAVGVGGIKHQTSTINFYEQ